MDRKAWHAAIHGVTGAFCPALSPATKQGAGLRRARGRWHAWPAHGVQAQPWKPSTGRSCWLCRPLPGAGPALCPHLQPQGLCEPALFPRDPRLQLRVPPRRESKRAEWDNHLHWGF